MNLCILSEGKRMLEPNSDLIGEFRRQRHRVLDFVFVVNCMFVYYLYNWVVMFVKGVIDLRAVLASELQYMSSRVLE